MTGKKYFPARTYLYNKIISNMSLFYREKNRCTVKHRRIYYVTYLYIRTINNDKFKYALWSAHMLQIVSNLYKYSWCAVRFIRINNIIILIYMRAQNMHMRHKAQTTSTVRGCHPENLYKIIVYVSLLQWMNGVCGCTYIFGNIASYTLRIYLFIYRTLRKGGKVCRRDDVACVSVKIICAV